MTTQMMTMQMRAPVRSRVHPAMRRVRQHKHHQHQHRHKAAPSNQGDDELAQVMANAQMAPPNVREEDFTNYYRILNAQSPEEASEAIDAMTRDGSLTEGVVEAALATYQTAQSKGEGPEIIAALKGLFEYLLDCYQRANVPPALGLIDACVSGLSALDDQTRADDAAQDAVVRDVLRDAQMSVEEFLANIDMFLQSMTQQDAQFDAQVAQMRAEGVDEEREQQIAQLVDMRGAAKEQMLVIRAISQRCLMSA